MCSVTSIASRSPDRRASYSPTKATTVKRFSAEVAVTVPARTASIISGTAISSSQPSGYAIQREMVANTRSD